MIKRAILSIAAMAALSPAMAQATDGPDEQAFTENVVLRTDDVVFRKIDAHTWVGTGHLVFNESIYLLEGKKRAMLIDCGTRMANLPQLVAKLTKKPVSLYLTHVHPDHAGSAINDFAEVWINPGDTVGVPRWMTDYKGKINYLKDKQIIDLGGRKVEVVFTPAHTPGSTTYVDLKQGVGYSGDSFGNGNLLLDMDFATLRESADKMERYMQRNGIGKLYNGHYFGNNAETPQRVADLSTISSDALSGKLTARPLPLGTYSGLTMIIDTLGVRINHGQRAYIGSLERRQHVDEVASLLGECGWFAIATADGSKPDVRPFGAISVFENELYIMSSKQKHVAKQIADNPYVTIMGVLPQGKGWIRIHALLVDDPRSTAKQAMLDSNPGLKGMYSTTDDHMIVWKLVDATATIYKGESSTELRF